MKKNGRGEGERRVGAGVIGQDTFVFWMDNMCLAELLHVAWEGGSNYQRDMANSMIAPTILTSSNNMRNEHLRRRLRRQAVSNSMLIFSSTYYSITTKSDS